MTGLLNALVLGGGLSLGAALLAGFLASILTRSQSAGDVAIWRAARLAVLAPVLLAPILFFLPAPAVSELAQLPLAHASQDIGGASRVAEEAPPAGLGALRVRLSGDTGTWLAAVWAMGIAFAGLGGWVRHRRRCGWMARSRQAVPSERLLLEALARQLGVMAPEMRICSTLASPVLTGWRPVILVPHSVLGDPQTARFALTHELTHLRRGDERDRLIGAALCLLLWFNWPLRRIEHQLHQARELACDADSLQALGRTQSKPYAAALISMLRGGAPAVSAFGAPDRRHREMRIKAILTGSARRAPSRLFGLILAGACIVPVAFAQNALTDHVGSAAPVDYVAPVPTVLPEPARPLADAQPMPSAAPILPVAAALSAQPVPANVAAPAAPAFTTPVVRGRLTSPYGPRPAQPAGAPPFHGGVDLAARTGAPIKAPGAGTVTYAESGLNGAMGWGNTLIIDHGDGWETLYSHLDGFDVAVGDQVEAGQHIGRVGTTGNSTGPHVHVELHHDGERVDPAGVIPGLR